ncbi:DUF2125 domain-containing protein [Falsihalocynthiibacter arcticus]|uniref:DUF2125 domain-containing protein n=1 Tax=Falsihalocynthiibacter arcticus TaxID=1579316 RepID=A0A126UW33_9RHOB|nr:DUF2125 domain-containing protein [Falsihalocynthiibacter arcticus]AML50087.1 hypothetical protein RC74_01265 [Falsihalocynthiibacter arcticus]
MRFFVWLLAIVSILWGGYWFVGANAVEKAAISAIEDATDAGNSITYSSLNTAGFPNRFDTTIKDIDIFTLSGLRWKAAFFQIFALSYKPYHIIAVWPHEQLIEYQGISAQISTSDLRASLVVKPNSTLALNRFQLTGEDLKVVLNAGTTYRSRAISAASRQGILPFSHDFLGKMSDVSLPSIMDPTGTVSIETVVLDTNLEFDAALGRGEVPAKLAALTLNQFSLSQGKVNITLSGALAFDSEGFATGSLTFSTPNWEDGFAMLDGLGAIPTEQSHMVKTVLKGLASTSGSATDIHAPITVNRGNIFLGFIPLGFIPPF